MRSFLALFVLSCLLSSCSLVTVPIGAAGRVASATVKATGGVAKAGFGAMGRSSQQAAPPQQPPQQAPQQQAYPYPQQYAPQYPPQQYAPPYPPQQQAYPPQQAQGYWYQGRWYPYAQPQRR